MTCSKCSGLILQPGVAYGINPNTVCKCDKPSPVTGGSGATLPPKTGDSLPLREKIKQIIYAPMRSEVSTADIAVGMWSSTMVSEKIYDLEKLFSATLKENERETRQGNMLEWIAKQDAINQQLFIGGLIYRMWMKETNADKVTVNLENFSADSVRIGNLKLVAELSQESKEGDSIVRLNLDCGHTRTWDRVKGKLQLYSNGEMAECKECGKEELIHRIIDKAHKAATKTKLETNSKERKEDE